MLLTSILVAVGLGLLLLGLVGLIFPALPGPPILFAGIVALAGADRFVRLDPLELVLLGVATAFVTFIDYIAGAAGARTFGGSAWSILAGAVGMVVGMPFGVVGVIAGGLAGVFVVELARVREPVAAIKISAGSFGGFVVGTVAKVLLSLGLLGLALRLYFN